MGESQPLHLDTIDDIETYLPQIITMMRNLKPESPIKPVLAIPLAEAIVALAAELRRLQKQPTA